VDFLGERFWHENKSDIENKLQQNFRGAEIICQEGKVLFRGRRVMPAWQMGLRKKMIILMVSNYEDNVWEEMRRIRDMLY